MNQRRFLGNSCSICGSNKGITYGSSTKINGKFISQHKTNECDICCVCKQSTNHFGEKLEKIGNRLIHSSCTQCQYCNSHTSIYGEIPELHNNNGRIWWQHQTCPRCATCGDSAKENDEIIIRWAKDDPTDQYHKACLVCELCHSTGVHHHDPVQIWTIEQANGISYAHLTCLRTRYCDIHQQYMPCDTLDQDMI